MLVPIDLKFNAMVLSPYNIQESIVLLLTVNRISLCQE